MAARRQPVPIAPAIHIQRPQQQSGQPGPSEHESRQFGHGTDTTHSVVTASSDGRRSRNLNISSSPSSSMPIPGLRRTPPPPPALPPPTHSDHEHHQSGTDLGWAWANARQQQQQQQQPQQQPQHHSQQQYHPHQQQSDMRPDSLSRPASPGSTSTWERRDSQRSLLDNEYRRRKSSTSTIASMRSPMAMETYDGHYRDERQPNTSPSVTSGELVTDRQHASRAYDDMLKRKISGGPPRTGSYEIAARGHGSREAALPLQPQPPSQLLQQQSRPLTLRSLSLQDATGPSSPRKLTASNDPHWNPADPDMVLTSPSIASTSRQSYFSDIRDMSPGENYASSSSVTSYGGSLQHKSEASFGRRQAPILPRRSRESGLSTMMSQNSSHARPSHRRSFGGSPGRNPQVACTTSGFNGHNLSELQDLEKSVDSPLSRGQRPAYIKEEVVILPTHHSDYSRPLAHSSERFNMKRKGAPDSSERDGPPLQQIQHEGRRSPNPATIPYASPQPNAYMPTQHMSSSTDRLSPSHNPLSESGHDRNSPYHAHLPIDPILHHQASQAYSDAQQLAAAAAHSVTVEHLNAVEESNTHQQQQQQQQQIPNQGPWVCDCCPKKPKKFNTEQELRTHVHEKQYVCSFCHNRFKNKNEMERHQMSLHLRDRSWSCAALERNYEAAFHPSTAIPPNNPGHAQQVTPFPPAKEDVCGYCGQHFPNPPDYVARGEHLTNIHKFAECNQSKKFWRADHFRQHLKHSHGGIPGKWTNMLEQACLKMEVSPLPAGQQVDDGGHMASQQAAAHAAKVAAEAAAQQAQQAVQQQQQQQYQDAHHLAPLSQYQAQQLQNATASADTRRGPYPSDDFGPLVTESGNE